MSPLSSFLKEYNRLRSKVIISLVRYSSTGVKSYRNTHPFQREVQGIEYAFAHNGTLHNFTERLPLGRYMPVGETDSEHAFCYLLSKLEEWGSEGYPPLHSILKRINLRGNFNCLLSNGRKLFCYHDESGYKGLSYTERRAPFSEIRLMDEDFEVNLAGTKDKNQFGFIMATKPFDGRKLDII